MDERILSVTDRCVRRQPTSRLDRRYLLSFDEGSEEAEYIISSADRFVKEACSSTGEIGVQIGVIVGPCYADCSFCNFASSTTDVEDFTMGDGELTRYLDRVAESRVVSSVSLMTIHNFDFDDFLHIVETARSILPEGIRVCSNTGDLEPSEAKELKKAGVDSAYHALRLGESIDNRLEPADRARTMRNLKAAGIPVAAGVEPIGPEHSMNEICESFEHAMGEKCMCCSASARVPVPGTRMFGLGSISDRKLKLIRSALLLSATDMNSTEFGFYGGFYGGFNRYFGEYSNSPKDREELSEKGMNHTVRWAAERLKADGYDKIRCPDGSVRPISDII
jgi:biotin synthase